ncbi:copper amine oxidase N-terminal domain-containing protein [Paenibacillus lignilyticus]|uniref:Copper amine oxidase N-terminal domain-containing protein n=1 Tax=Paenibacillus lignilyticus TaxID=1172615 RepID=A0ABS5C7Z2_9BACL|nr:copper amine oxidase N-terminal domain-containing protein [Paenibacillus lignilyticus]MBP3962028.1 copper amine oxidase N-terminal domain-containing protein [Paenibacillus lignilyticus]
MKKLVVVFVMVLSMVLPIGAASGSAKSAVKIVTPDLPIEVLYNARKIGFDVPPKMIEGTVVIPVRYVSEKLQANVSVQGKTIYISKGDREIQLTTGSKAAVINGKSVTLAQPAIVEKGRTLVPIRVVSEGLGVVVEWDAVSQFVWIGNKDVPLLSDVVKPVDFKLFRDYYEDAPEYLLNGGFGTYTNVTVVSVNDFPFKNGMNTYFRFDFVYDQNKKMYFQTIKETGATLNSNYYFLSKGSKPVTSYGLTYLTKIPIKGTHIYYNDTSKLGEKIDFKTSKIDFIDLRDVIQIGNGKSSSILIKNPWR